MRQTTPPQTLSASASLCVSSPSLLSRLLLSNGKMSSPTAVPAAAQREAQEQLERDQQSQSQRVKPRAQKATVAAPVDTKREPGALAFLAPAGPLASSFTLGGVSG